MRYLVIYAHPVASSFVSAIHRTIVDALSSAGHDVDDCDLYAEGFQPALTAEERLVYHDAEKNGALVHRDIERLRRCEGLVFVFPTWNYGIPAILKGYIDRVWLPGVAFKLASGHPRSLLGHITRFGVVTTYGSPWWLNALALGHPNKKTFMRGFRRLVSSRARVLWLAQYGMDDIPLSERERFLSHVSERFRRF
jgi:putative NADPH-quinone reductase